MLLDCHFLEILYIYINKYKYIKINYFNIFILYIRNISYISIFIL